MNVVLKTLNIFTDFILPQDCILCEQETPNILLCNNCLDYLPEVHPPLCDRCGRPIVKSRICTFCEDGANIDHGRAWLYFVPPVNLLIHHLKYRHKKRLATMLGHAMALIISSDSVLCSADYITPVPLFWLKEFRRGYNQSSLIAEVISTNTGIEKRDILKRTRYTHTQTTLTEDARMKNVTNAFVVTKEDIVNSKVLVIDDVLTTGATMNACAQALKQAGAAAVYSCVAAITPSPFSRHCPA